MFLTLSAAIFSLKGTSGSLVFVSILLLGCNNVIARNKTFVFYLSTLVEDALLCLLWNLKHMHPSLKMQEVEGSYFQRKNR